MKAINSKDLSADLFDELKEFVGKDNFYKVGENPVIRPETPEALSKAIIRIIEEGGEVLPKAITKHSNDAVLVDVSLMNSIVKVDTENMTIRAQAGAKFSDLIDAAAKVGFSLGVIPGGADATVEDWVYREAPGIGSYKYGTVKDSIYNLIAIDYKGETIEAGYDHIGYYMSGYNIIQSLTASYGKLAIITEATFKIVPAGVTKAVAYDLPDAEKTQEALLKIAQEPSAKPLHISFCGNKVIIACQGDEAFVDADLAIIDGIVTELGGVLRDDGQASFDELPSCDCVDPKAVTYYVPLTGFAGFLNAVKELGECKICGNIPDCSTVAFKLVNGEKELYDAAIEKAEALGGRCGCRCCSKYRDEGTNAYIKRIEDSFNGAPVEDVNLPRKVTDAVIEELKEAVGAKNVNTNNVDKLIYCHDLAPLPKEAGIAFDNIPDVIVRPENVGHISKVMAIAYKYGIAVTPRGNATWGLGGSMPAAGGIIIDMTSKLNKVIEINKEERYVKVMAGCTWKKLLDTCMKQGYIVGSYPSSFPAGTIGAWISTNGMGIGSFKYGSAKDNILNAEIVVDDGTIVTTGFDNTGSYAAPFNLNQFFSGAEGTLGMLGTVTFRIYPTGEIRCLAYEFDKLSDANQPIQDIIASPSVRPLHIAWSDYMHFENQRRAGCHAPDVTNLWLVTLQGDAQHNDLEEAFVDAVAEKAGGRKVATEIAEHEWSERCYEFRARKVGVGEIPAEVIVPARFWGTMVEECYKGFDKMNMEPGGIIGVMVDRSTTLFMPYYFKDDELITGLLPFGFNFFMGDVAAKYGGRSTGLGVFFAWLLDVIHDAPTAGKMREMKTVLDSHDVVNPGHVVCGATRFGINLSKPIMSLASVALQGIKQLFPKDKTFADNLKRFRYNDLEHVKVLDRHHKLGDGTS